MKRFLTLLAVLVAALLTPASAQSLPRQHGFARAHYGPRGDLRVEMGDQQGRLLAVAEIRTRPLPVASSSRQARVRVRTAGGFYQALGWSQLTYYGVTIFRFHGSATSLWFNFENDGGATDLGCWGVNTPATPACWLGDVFEANPGPDLLAAARRRRYRQETRRRTGP